MTSEPEVIGILKRCGVRQQNIADKLHVPKSAVSMWTKGTRPIPERHLPDLWALAALAQAVAAGVCDRDVLTFFQPTVWGSEGLDFAEAGTIRLPEDMMDKLDAVNAAWSRGDETPLQGLFLVAASRQFAPYATADPLALGLDAPTLEKLRHEAMSLLSSIRSWQVALAKHGMTDSVGEETDE
jgi:predicted transcriptional regulator